MSISPLVRLRVIGIVIAIAVFCFLFFGSAIENEFGIPVAQGRAFFLLLVALSIGMMNWQALQNVGGFGGGRRR